jgi:hypothetical protein
MNNKELTSLFIWFFVWIIIIELIVYIGGFIYQTYEDGDFNFITLNHAFIKSLPVMFCVLIGFIAGFICVWFTVISFIIIYIAVKDDTNKIDDKDLDKYVL